MARRRRPAEVAMGVPVHLTPAEAAARLQVHPRTVAEWAKQGKLPVQKTLGGNRRYPREGVEKVAQEMGLK